MAWYRQFKSKSKKTKTDNGHRSGPYVIVNYRSDDDIKRQWGNLTHIRCVSIDPAQKNFAIRVEDRPTPLGSGIRPILFHKQCFTELSDLSNRWSLFSSITDYLDSQREILSQAHVVVIEQQVPMNYLMIRVSSHVVAYFISLLKDSPNRPMIIEICPKHVKEILGFPDDVNDKIHARKMASALCKSRGDLQSSQIIDTDRTHKGVLKGDDLGDAILQLEVFFMHMNWPNMQDPKCNMIRS